MDPGLALDQSPAFWLLVELSLGNMVKEIVLGLQGSHGRPGFWGSICFSLLLWLKVLNISSMWRGHQHQWLDCGEGLTWWQEAGGGSEQQPFPSQHPRLQRHKCRSE